MRGQMAGITATTPGDEESETAVPAEAVAAEAEEAAVPRAATQVAMFRGLASTA